MFNLQNTLNSLLNFINFKPISQEIIHHNYHQSITSNNSKQPQLSNSNFYAIIISLIQFSLFLVQTNPIKHPSDQQMKQTVTLSPNTQNNFVGSLLKPLLVGSLSGSIATCFIQPIDTVKVIIQVKKEAAKKNIVNLSPFHVCGEVIEHNGFLGLYRGLDSALLRQVVYCGIRLGLYRKFEDDIKLKEKRTMTFGEKICYSLLAGLIGSAISNPLDMSLIRFQADNGLPPLERRNYRNVFDALTKMNRELHFFGMWRGSVPTIARAMVINMLMLVSYNEVKEQLQRYLGQTKQTTFIRLTASAISGIFASVGSLLFDNMKTKMLKMKPNSAGQLPYHHIIDCFAKSIKNEGFLNLWVGLPTYYCRGAPHAMITILAQDYIHDLISSSSKIQ